jgi:hypothetical protein
MAADREWFTVETPSGVVVIDHEFPNKESAVEAARKAAPGENQPLAVVKYVRKEIRTFTKRILVDEADVGTGAASPA